MNTYRATVTAVIKMESDHEFTDEEVIKFCRKDPEKFLRCIRWIGVERERRCEMSEEVGGSKNPNRKLDNLDELDKEFCETLDKLVGLHRRIMIRAHKIPWAKLDQKG